MANQARACRKLMPSITISMLPHRVMDGRMVFGGLLCISACLWPIESFSSSKPAAVNVTEPSSDTKPDPDVLLIDVYNELAENKLNEAQAKVDALVEAYPNFHLGQLIRGDLLRGRT